jgi:proline iminopeptidase
MKIYLSLAAGIVSLGIQIFVFMALFGIPPFGPGDDDVIWALPFAGLLTLGLSAIGLGTAIIARRDKPAGRALSTASLVVNGISLAIPFALLLLAVTRTLVSTAKAGVGTTNARAAGKTAEPMPREGYVDAGRGVRLFYRIEGDGRDTVVVLHGGPGFSMNYIAPDLAPLAARHSLLFYDQRGAGRSTLVTDSISLDARRFVEDLESVRVWFGLQKLTLLAHSWGAGVAALYAGRYPEKVGRLIVVDAIPVRRAQRPEGFRRLDARRDSVTRGRLQELRAVNAAHPEDTAACRAYYRLWFRDTYGDTSAAGRSRGDYCADPPEALVNKIRSVDRYTLSSLGDWDWSAGLRSVAAPALVIHGTADFVPPESAREWAAPLPNGRLLLIEGSGHFPYVEAPGPFFAAVESFLDGQWPPGAEAVPTPAGR